MPEREQIMLRCTQGSSDKGYSAIIAPENSGWTVNCSNGRWGSTFALQDKTPDGPVEYETAKRIFDKVIREKLAKGYKIVSGGNAGAAACVTSREAKETGIFPQLLNAITEDEVNLLLADENFLMQEKHDGKRILLQVKDGKVTAINRKGLVCGVYEGIATDALSASECNELGDCIIDGEACGSTFFAFDLLKFRGKDIRSDTYGRRYNFLSGALRGSGYQNLILSETKDSTETKRQLFTYLRNTNAEGVVFKRRMAQYSEGRPATGGDQLKFKFWASATCRVLPGREGKRSIGIGVNESVCNQRLVNVGNVTIPPNKEVPKIGSLVEIKYLYAYKGGSLYQPQFLGVRDDIGCPDHLDQLKYKPENADEDES